MADNENTITTIFRADISQFSSSAQDMRKYMARVNAEFNDATAGMGKFSDSAEGLRAKITQLKGTLQAQQKQLKALEDTYNSLTDEQKKNSAEGQRLGTEILNQRAKVKKTQASIDEYSGSLKDLEKAGVGTKQELDKLNKSIVENGNKSKKVVATIAKGIGKGLLAIGAAVAGAITAFLALGESTRDFRKGEAQLQTAFAQSGKSADTANNAFANLNAVLGDSSKSIKSLQQLAVFTKDEEDLAEYTDILTGVFAKFGDNIPTGALAEGINHTIQLGSVQGKLADALELSGVSVDEFNATLATCTTEEERSALIKKTLNDLYGESAKQYKEANKDIIEAGKAQTKLTQATASLGAVAEPIMTFIKSTLADLLASLSPFVKLVGSGLMGALTGAKDGAVQLSNGISGLFGALIEKITDILPMVSEVVGKLVPSILSTILDQLPKVLSVGVQLVASLVNGIAQALPTLIPEAVNCVVSLVTALLDNIGLIIDAGVQLIGGLTLGLINAIPALVARMPDIINSILSALYNALPQLVSAGFELSTKISLGMLEAIPQMVENIPQIVSALVEGLKKGVADMAYVGIELVKGLWEGIKSRAKWLGDKIKNFGKNVVDGFKRVFNIHSPSRVMRDTIGKNLALGIGEGFDDQMGNVSKSMQKSLGQIRPSLAIDTGAVSGVGALSGSVSNNNQAILSQLASLINGRQGNVTNNYSFDYQFKGMETSKLALHKAVLETKRALEG